MAIVLLVIVYFVPAIIALFRSHANLGAIIALNLLLGWTFIGWVGAFIWSFTNSPKPGTIIINNGVATSEEKK